MILPKISILLWLVFLPTSTSVVILLHFIILREYDEDILKKIYAVFRLLQFLWSSGTIEEEEVQKSVNIAWRHLWTVPKDKMEAFHLRYPYTYLQVYGPKLCAQTKAYATVYGRCTQIISDWRSVPELFRNLSPKVLAGPNIPWMTTSSSFRQPLIDCGDGGGTAV